MTLRLRVLALAVFACSAFGGAPQIFAATSDAIELAQAEQPQPSPLPGPLPTPAPQASAASAAQTSSEEPVGNVATVTGVATVIRNKNSIAVKVRDDIYLNDVVQTAADSAIGITFSDATTFNLSANARITIDAFVYENGGKQNAGIFDVGRGTVAFVAAALAKTGDMKITTPTATLGIRGTSGVVEVPEGAAAGSARNVSIKLYPDADGKVGRIEVHDRSGARLGLLSHAASGFAIRPGSGGLRFAAVPLAISLQQARRDQGFVRQVHVAQNIGRRIVTEQRALRRATPGVNNRDNQLRQPGQPGQPLQRRNGVPGQHRPGLQQTTTPGRQGAKPQGAHPQGAQPQSTRPQRQGTQPPGQSGKQQPRLPQQGTPRAAPAQLPAAPHTRQSPQGAPVGVPAIQPQQGASQRLPGVQPRPPALQRGAPAKPAPRRPAKDPAKDRDDKR